MRTSPTRSSRSRRTVARPRRRTRPRRTSTAPTASTYRVTDRGDPDNCGAPGAGCDAPEVSTTQTVSITVDAINDAPVNTLPAGPVLALPNTNTPITGVSIADVDAAADDLEVTLSVTSGTLTVALVPGGVTNITGNGSGTVVLQGSLLELNTTFGAANGLVFNGAASTTLTVTTSDLGNNGSGGPLTDTDMVAISVNTPPVAQTQSPSTNEDTPLTVTLSASDADGDALTFAIGTGPANGSLGAIGPVTCGVTPNVCTASVLYTPALNFNGTDGFTYTANDGANTSAAATVTITINAVNDAPSFVSGGNVTVNEDSGPHSAAWATSISAGPANESGQTVTFSVSNDNNALFAVQPAVSPTGVLTLHAGRERERVGHRLGLLERQRRHRQRR